MNQEIPTAPGAGEQEDIQSRLETPGAGIPWLEGKLMGLGFRLMARRLSRQQILAKFEAEAGRMLAMVEPLPEEQGRKRVLIPRQRGMEDSSRFWSPYMILQHVTIVNRGMTMLLRGMSHGKLPDRKVSTADVKPKLDAGPQEIASFRDTVASCSDIIRSLGPLDPALRHLHPWFGRMNASQWLCLMTEHHGVHRRQMELVLK